MAAPNESMPPQGPVPPGDRRSPEDPAGSAGPVPPAEPGTVRGAAPAGTPTLEPRPIPPMPVEPAAEPVPLTITGVQLFWLRMPLVAPFETSYGRVDRRECLLVRLEARHPEAGPVEGWGEVVADADPGYSYETTGTAWHVLSEFVLPALPGRTFETPGQWRAAFEWVRGHPMAKAGVEMALLDARSRARGVPLWQEYGGDPGRRRIPVGVSVGIQPTLDDLLATVERWLERGYRRIKIKIKPGYEVEPVRALRERFGDIPLMVDANAAYTLADAERLEALDGYGLMMIEQPLHEDDLLDHALLQRRLRTPVCLDESVRHVHAAREALVLGSGRIINIKQGRVGGPTDARMIHDLCRRHGIPVWCGGMLETGVGRAHNIALTTLPGFTLPGDTSGSNRYYHEDVIDPPVRVGPDGTIEVPQEPGLGFRVVPERVERYTVRHRSWRAS
ncbi:O-succinylbenzoate synthase [Thermaerobacter marianensis DSM 12885]|uniref:o-succinylbenzoate synthase n=1 Tax=Thermaerobacter marianensis (strain ATCC 700841 / DSM 12885 / JCM 10246 / 7p75a) TaxID=644966 RepID=E6SGX2_THEM7|nr:o-succinylbenzoate synthase [Thermaerobacter marianensis]ADU50603.1 O-succinylbenzoate synthase [Thermaerobacter marianensis DSM 12885]